MVMAVSFVSASAPTVTTEVTIASGGGNIPTVKAKWEQDLTPSLEDGDPTHAVAGGQFLPPCSYKGIKTVEYFAVVNDTEDNGDVKIVSADVYHPDGSFKYQIILAPLDRVTGLAKLDAAQSAGLITFGAGFSFTEVRFEVDKQTAKVWYGKADLDYHQMGGDYKVKVMAIDNNDNPSVPLNNTFNYVPTNCFEIDFTSVNYGSVSISKRKVIAGDTNFGTADFPTVRNIGNTDIKIKVKQDDMGFGKDSNNNWNVQYDAKINSSSASVYYDPYVETTIPFVLKRCNTDEIDFSILVKKGLGSHSGTMTLSSIKV